MKKVYLKAYLTKNLGDDLFVKILCDRYYDSFIINNNPRFKYNKISKNLITNRSYLKYILRKAVEKKHNNKHYNESLLIKQCDLMVTIGGSIFIENINNKEQLNNLVNTYNNKIDKLILGANFGPYKSEDFKKTIEKEVFSKCIDVSFRDTYSYNLFSNLPNVRCNPDIILSLNEENLNVKANKLAIISVIDCTEREINKEKYEDKIIDFIKYFAKKGYEVLLMSFCKYEHDEEAIKSIIKKFKKSREEIKVKKYFYRGNILEALSIIASASVIIGSRFHANILGLKLNKITIPIAYSDKTINALTDLGYKSKIYDARKMDEIIIDDEFEKSLYYHCDISKKVIESENHFSVLDKILNKR